MIVVVSSPFVSPFPIGIDILSPGSFIFANSIVCLWDYLVGKIPLILINRDHLIGLSLFRRYWNLLFPGNWNWFPILPGIGLLYCNLYLRWDSLSLCFLRSLLLRFLRSLLLRRTFLLTFLDKLRRLVPLCLLRFSIPVVSFSRRSCHFPPIGRQLHPLFFLSRLVLGFFGRRFLGRRRWLQLISIHCCWFLSHTFALCL